MQLLNDQLRNNTGLLIVLNGIEITRRLTNLTGLTFTFNRTKWN